MMCFHLVFRQGWWRCRGVHFRIALHQEKLICEAASCCHSRCNVRARACSAPFTGFTKTRLGQGMADVVAGTDQVSTRIRPPTWLL